LTTSAQNQNRNLYQMRCRLWG